MSRHSVQACERGSGPYKYPFWNQVAAFQVPVPLPSLDVISSPAKMEADKSTTQHVDTIESVNNSDHNVTLKHVNSANEEIVQHLRTTGEEIGMTWRTFMAAVVSSVDLYATNAS